MLIGHSGVGKSSLLTALDPAIAARIGELVAQGTKMVRGAHTTTSASLHG
jgi:putative ribosome biogenesis GTPase RsgA